MSDAGNRSGGTDDGGGNVASVTTGTLPTMVITMIMWCRPFTCSQDTARRSGSVTESRSFLNPG